AKNSTFLQEGYSLKYAPTLVRKVWNNAADLGYGSFFPFKKAKNPVIDDHYYINLIAGIPTIDIIDFSYQYKGKNIWHTPRDLPSHCSPQSLKCIGDVLFYWLSRQ
ncbi:MAG: peptidase, partial [Candidatus Neomarinimicrobiota bacterium]